MRRPVVWRRVRLAAWLALAALLLAHPVARAASDVFSNVGPGSSTAGLSDRYALSHYALDQHFDAIHASLTGGIDVSGVPPLLAYFLADVIWQLTAFIANAVITLFGFAFSLDLINGSQATGGAGALGPVSQAVRSIYTSVFGGPWMVLAVTAAGLWAMWKALVQRRYAETLGALGLSLLFSIVALAFVTQPERTIGQASHWTNELSAAFLSLSTSGTLTDQRQARQQASDQLFSLLVYDPWAVLNFGGLEHCVKAPVKDPPESVRVRPLSRDPGRDAQLFQQLKTADQIAADAKVCINDRNKYADRFLAYPPESDDRDAEYDALKDGDTGKLPASDPTKKAGTYALGPADTPAAEAMGKSGQRQRLLLAVVVLIGELGAWLLLGGLSIGVILAQVLVLLLLAFAPVALVAAIYPGRGHDLFRGWLARLATFLVRKAIYSLILAVLLAVVAALQDATGNLGWLLSFGLQAVFLWTVFLYRHQLTQVATRATTGHEAARAQRLSLPSLYWASRLTRTISRDGRRRPPASGPPPSPAGPAATSPRRTGKDGPTPSGARARPDRPEQPSKRTTAADTRPSTAAPASPNRTDGDATAPPAPAPDAGDHRRRPQAAAPPASPTAPPRAPGPTEPSTLTDVPSAPARRLAPSRTGPAVSLLDDLRADRQRLRRASGAHDRAERKTPPTPSAPAAPRPAPVTPPRDQRRSE